MFTHYTLKWLIKQLIGIINTNVNNRAQKFRRVYENGTMVCSQKVCIFNTGLRSKKNFDPYGATLCFINTKTYILARTIAVLSQS